MAISEMIYAGDCNNRGLKLLFAEAFSFSHVNSLPVFLPLFFCFLLTFANMFCWIL